MGRPRSEKKSRATGKNPPATVPSDEKRSSLTRRRSDLIIGTSPVVRRVLELMGVVARTDFPVLLQGETGTGKELVARGIHYSGARATRPFITLNCGTIPETLMEDELFGHVRGAFTGAHKDKKGVFEEADGGTLFLDEIGELQPSCQVKLLRVLQESEVRRLGDTGNRKVDVRIIAATNKKLNVEMEAKRFRDDLFHRISVLPIDLPPLRERLEDIPLLVDHFVREFNREMGKEIKGFTPRALRRLKTHHWPGNVRELENRVKRAMVFAKGNSVDTEALTLFSNRSPGGEFPRFRDAKLEFEKNYVVQALLITGGKVAVAARMAGKDRKDFYQLMKRHGIRPDDYRN